MDLGPHVGADVASVFPHAGFQLRIFRGILNHLDGFHPRRGDHANLDRAGAEPARTRRDARIGSRSQPAGAKLVRSRFLHGNARLGAGALAHLQLHGTRLTPPGPDFEGHRHPGEQRRALRPNLQMGDARGHEVRRVRQEITRARIEPRPDERHEHHGDGQNAGEPSEPLKTGMRDVSTRIERFHFPAGVVHQRVDERGRSGIVVAKLPFAREELQRTDEVASQIRVGIFDVEGDTLAPRSAGRQPPAPDERRAEQKNRQPGVDDGRIPEADLGDDRRRSEQQNGQYAQQQNHPRFEAPDFEASANHGIEKLVYLFERSFGHLSFPSHE